MYVVKGVVPAEVGAVLMRAIEAAGDRCTGWSLRPRYKRAADIPWTIPARALEALDDAHVGAREKLRCQPVP